MTDEARNSATGDPETRRASAEADAPARADNSDAAARDDDARSPLRLQGELEPRADGRYRVEELFAFHDRAFVENSFRAALGREPGAAELEATLADLRSARRSKQEIIEDLIFSDEGASVGARARVGGVRDSRLRRRVRGLPVVGYLWQLLAGVARLPRLMRHQREFEAYALARQQLIADRLNEHERLSRAFIAEQLRLALERLDADVIAPINDAREAIFMLSDALASLAARHEQAVKQLERGEAQLAASLGAHRQGIEELQNALNAQQVALEGRTRELEEQRRRLDAQEEFLIQEQRAIVEAQKAALAEIEERVREVESAAARLAPDAPASGSRAREDAGGAPRGAREA